MKLYLVIYCYWTRRKYLSSRINKVSLDCIAFSIIETVVMFQSDRPSNVPACPAVTTTYSQICQDIPPIQDPREKLHEICHRRWGRLAWYQVLHSHPRRAGPNTIPSFCLSSVRFRLLLFYDVGTFSIHHVTCCLATSPSSHHKMAAEHAVCVYPVV